MKRRQDSCVILQLLGAGGFQGNAEYRWWWWACRGSGMRTGVHGREGGSTGISTPLGFCWGCHISVTGVVYDRHSIFSSVEPHLVAFLHHFCVCVYVLVSAFGIFRLLCLRTGNGKAGQGAWERAGLAEVPLPLSHLPVPGCNLEVQKLSSLMSFPAALPCCAISPRVARNDLIVLAKPQFVLWGPPRASRRHFIQPSCWHLRWDRWTVPGGDISLHWLAQITHFRVSVRWNDSHPKFQSTRLQPPRRMRRKKTHYY